ncbi:GNAT family N-acetyltransferase [Lactiplantibacillus plantarum]|nr:GNAT family N-acetyltransferase [Lactiplantibacillus plantarum]
MVYKIRQAIPSDLVNIQTFYQESLPLIDPIQTSWILGVYPTVADAKLAISNEELFICLGEHNVIVGSMILNNKSDTEYQHLMWAQSDAHATHLIVHTLISHPKRLKKGIGSQMLNFARKYAAEINAFSIRLDTLVENIPAQNLYKEKGFSYIERHNLTSFDGNGNGIDDCVFYELKI